MNIAWRAHRALVLVAALAILAPVVAAAAPGSQGAARLAPASLEEALEEHCEDGRIPPRVFVDARRHDLLVSVHAVCADASTVSARDATASATPLAPADGCVAEAYQLSNHRWTKPWAGRVDARNSGLADAAALGAFDAGALAWDEVTQADVYSGVTIGGSGARAGTRDNVNQVGWQDLGGTGVLARAITWFRSDGSALEGDVIVNTRYSWSTTGAAGRPDLQSVATHEVGHILGLDHAPSIHANRCLTMYPSVSSGTTHARTLGKGDVLGIQRKYGSAEAPPPPPPPPAPVEPFAVTFTPSPGNAWWVTTDVSANRPIVRVTATIEGGATHDLEKKWWGPYAASFHAPAGTKIRFAAYAQDGSRVESGLYSWPDAQPATGNPTFDARIVKHAGNAWWVEVRVEDANLPLAGVAVLVDGGSPVALARTNWGTWARSFHVPAGSTVVAVATAEDGQTVTSAAMTW